MSQLRRLTAITYMHAYMHAYIQAFFHALVVKLYTLHVMPGDHGSDTQAQDCYISIVEF